jgi:hypothetical protein
MNTFNIRSLLLFSALLAGLFGNAVSAATPDINNFRLNYSVAGYDSRGTKMVLVRTVAPITATDLSTTESRWNLKNAGGSIVASGAITYSGITYGIQYWVADFSAFKTEGTYSMEVMLKQNSSTSIGSKQTLNFTIQRNNFSNTILIPLSLNNADARKSPAFPGYYDCSSHMHEAYSHAVFLNGLLQMYKYKQASLSNSDRTRLIADVNLAFDNLAGLCTSNGQFYHEWGGTEILGGMNDIEPCWAMAAYMDLFKTVDPVRAGSVNFNKVKTSFNFLASSAPGWQDAGYQIYKDYLIPTAVHLYNYSGDTAWKTEAIRRLNTFLDSFDLRTYYRSPFRGIPLCEGLQYCVEQFPTHPDHAGWISHAQSIKNNYYASVKIMTQNVFHIVGTCAKTSAAYDWDNGRLTSSDWGSLVINDAFAPYAVDALILAEITGDSSLEKVAAGEINWEFGLNPGAPQNAVLNPSSTADWESAAFLINAPFRHVQEWWPPDTLKMLNTTYMTTVNGFSQDFVYNKAAAYNGELFIKQDGGLIFAGVRYEDYLTKREQQTGTSRAALRPGLGEGIEFVAVVNPFGPGIVLRYRVPVSATARPLRLSIYNARGALVATLVDRTIEPGTFEAVWNAGGMPSGIYVARLNGSKAGCSKKIMLLNKR